MWKRLALATLLVGLIVVGHSGAASADVNDFTITNFSAKETLTRDDPQGDGRLDAGRMPASRIPACVHSARGESEFVADVGT